MADTQDVENKVNHTLRKASSTFSPSKLRQTSGSPSKTSSKKSAPSSPLTLDLSKGLAKASTRTLKRKFSVSNSPLKLRGGGVPVERNPDDDYDISASCTERSYMEDELSRHTEDSTSKSLKRSRNEGEDTSEMQSSEREGQSSHESASTSQSSTKKRRLMTASNQGLTSSLSSPLKKSTIAMADGISNSISSSVPVISSTLASPLKKLRGGAGVPSLSLSMSMSLSVSADEESRRLSRSASNESIGLVSSLAEVERVEIDEDFTPLLSNSEGWINEAGFTSTDKKIDFDIEKKCNSETKWYATYFLGKDSHVDYVATEVDNGNTVVISVVRSDNEGFLKTIIRAESGTFKHEIFVGYQNCDKISRKVVKKYILAGTESVTGIGKIKDLRALKEESVKETLKKLEEQEEPQQFKIGVFYVKEGQFDEDEMFQNHGEQSESYEKFLAVLGTRVNLLDFSGYNGGLDVSQGQRTGTESVYTAYRGYEIMYHVSTMLPFTEDDEQQLDKKRHLGNDVSMVVFMDRAPNSNYQYAPATIKTHFNHVLCVVSPAPDSIPSQVEITAETTATTARSVPTTPRGTTSMGEEPELEVGDVDLSRSASSDCLMSRLSAENISLQGPPTAHDLQQLARDLLPAHVLQASVEQMKPKQNYFVQFTKKENVPDFGPSLPSPPLVVKADNLRDVLLCKMINGELAAYEAPEFKEKLRKTRSILLKSFAGLSTL